MERSFILIILFLVFCSPVSRVFGQTENPPQANGSLHVFINCDTWLCDFDYFRTEITFVNYVRDRKDADVHILITTQETGGGGLAFTLSFIGLGRFEKIDETLTYSSRQTDTEDEIRVELAQYIRAGLIRYISRTPTLSHLKFSYTPGIQPTVAQISQQEDPWNFWIFRTRFTGNGNGEDRYKSFTLNGNFSANRTTDASKLILSFGGSRNSQRFKLFDGSETKSITESVNSSAKYIRSLSPHFSLGGFASANHSNHANYDLDLKVGPGIEYNVFPYSESTRRALAFRYRLNLELADYADSTIYNKTEETLFEQSASAAIILKQPWGSVTTFVDGDTYLHDVSKLNLDVGGNIELRIFRGLSFDLSGVVSLVRNQLNVARGDASTEDVLLRRRELETNWTYFLYFGLTYQFGSKINNVVNPRFDDLELYFFY